MHKRPSLGITKSTRATVSVGELVRREHFPQSSLPLVMKPAIDGVDLLSWAEENREVIARDLFVYGGILFRGFGIATPSALQELISRLSGDLLEYTYKSTPRSAVEGRVYTSTEYPASQSIPLHNEMSYSSTWPLKIGFCCVQAAERGGETPIADSRKVWARLPEPIRQRFHDRRVMYVRNYGTGVDLRWEDVFQTTRREEVEQFCAQEGIEVEWLAGDRLRTRQVCQAVARHPTTGDCVWFNQAHLFHVSSLDRELRDSLSATFGEAGLPRNAYYGDGSPIRDEDLEAIRAAYREETVAFPWEPGDVLLLDNMLVAHGRTPFEGNRKILVGMAEAYRERS
jgi:alpha-ketoglutarate-dependent taurine dioxygenase